MYIFEIIKPGAFLDYDDNKWCWEVSNMLENLESIFFETNLAFNFFNNEFHNKTESVDFELMERNFSRVHEILTESKGEQGANLSFEDHLNLSFEASAKVTREGWESGVTPRLFRDRPKFMYAKAFLCAVDSFVRFLRLLSEKQGVPEEISNIYNEIVLFLPNLRFVRNTINHHEDRTRGLATNKESSVMDLKPIDNGFLSIPDGGILVLDTLNGRRYGTVMADGNFGEVDISEETMCFLQGKFSSVLNSFKWKGMKVLLPE